MNMTTSEEMQDYANSHGDKILELYTEQLDDFPESIYEGVLDDDYQDAEEAYLEGLTIHDVPDQFIQDLLEKEHE